MRRTSLLLILGLLGGTARAGDVPPAPDALEPLVAEATERLDRGDAAGAAAAAARAVEVLAGLTAPLSDAAAARVREQAARVFALGARAATGLGDSALASFFLESGRASVLLRNLAERDALKRATVPPDVLEAEAAARRAVVEASAALAATPGDGDLARLRERRRALVAALDALLLAVEATDHRARSAAGALAAPRVTPLEAIRARLRVDEALVVYGSFVTATTAVVVTAAGARVVALGPTAPIEAAVAGEAWDQVRAAVVTPLALPRDVRRWIVSPAGVLSFAPFCLLDPDRALSYVPSATTYGLLLDRAAPAGSGVLAVADPRRAPGTRRSGPPLPGARAEAQAVGDVVLAGEAATADGLWKALASRPRWRALHLAATFYPDAERPMLSAFALAGADELALIDVMRARVDADLVVLSACDTARGRVVAGEGVVGPVRAFIAAGASRVLASTGKVDDEATRGLMTAFYARWHPKDGSAGLPAATALREAQRAVAAQDRWKDPKYWGSWQLWGLPD